ncbi:hypothetical protein SARC_01095 [Sphaeroforma arctica JP610]|uniref:SWIM-type domain-containing protein n=1 Tax=Sphaeroforma arctica JP610 TaxID=667725 RepID=A0A0L0GCZ5_9EUKA|nr:hypothetical protein SARC_01095 [Sphaeroforma arctica JP610]KNC86761.1 hypothetical protein SARC_01095 [Sphaeroforma arctica JP610]|eukprot:XP_014160663.1 hypothetical protein SARC_01095 [Sphaeroforma arctica JP610]
MNSQEEYNQIRRMSRTTGKTLRTHLSRHSITTDNVVVPQRNSKMSHIHTHKRQTVFVNFGSSNAHIRPRGKQAKKHSDTISLRGCQSILKKSSTRPVEAKCLHETIIAGVLEQLAAAVEAQDQKQTSKALLALNHLFPDHALEATKIVDLRPPMRVRTTHNRELYQVTGPLKGRLHITMIREHFCDCLDFAINVLTDRSFYCKHLLAVRIATRLGKCSDIDLHEQAFQTLFIGDAD